MGTLILIIIIAVIVYYLIKGKKNGGNKKNSDVIKVDGLTETINIKRPEIGSTDEDKQHKQRFDQIVAENKDLEKLYNNIITMIVIDKNGESTGKLASIIMSEEERAKKLEKADKQVIDALGKDKDAYESWWTTVYNDAINGIIDGDNEAAKALMLIVLDSVQKFDASLAEDSELANEVKNLGVRGCQDFFKGGLSNDPLIRLGEIAISAPSIVQMKYKNHLVNTKWIEAYKMPSLSKIS